MDKRELQLSPRSVHLCVDMQRMFSAEGIWPTPWLQRVLPQCAALADRCPTRTIFTRFTTPPNPQSAKGAWRDFYERWPQATREQVDPSFLELVPELSRYTPPALVFDRPVYSAFASRALVANLVERGVDSLILTGAETDVCVLATALAAIDYGFRIVLVTDAVCSFSDEGHESLIELFQRRFSQQAATTDTETVLRHWPVD